MNTQLQVVTAFLQETPMCFMATVSENKPKVRPFQFQFEKDNKLWFCTAKSKEVFKQLKNNNFVQISAVKPDFSTLRFEGAVVFEDNYSVKEKIIEEQALVKSVYGSADNPDFTTFYIEHGAYIIFDFSGNPPCEGCF